MTHSVRNTVLACVTAVALLASALTSDVRAATVMPTLRLIQATSDVTLLAFPGEGAYLDLGLYLAATEAPFEIRLTRPDYSQPIQVTQMLSTTSGGSESRALPHDVLDSWLGFNDFLDVRINNADGKVVQEYSSTFCPNSDRQRVDDEGPTQATYFEGCRANPFTRSVMWGIDEGWSVNLLGYASEPVALRRGRYVVTTTITPRYVELFGMDPAATTATTNVRVKMYDEGPCGRRCRIGRPAECHDGRCGSDASPAFHSSLAVPLVTDPADDVLPDLLPLPAWGIGVQNGRFRDRLTFGATVWVDGSSPLVVEGFRRSGQDTMDAYQYFYEDGEPVGRAPAGELEYDQRDGHDHWHFKQFANYSLLASDQTEIVASKKEAFCLAPTDPIDILLPGAERNPNLIGLGTACGGPSAIWIREVLPLGWGDTYFQGLPGQSFNITDLPNGTYYIAVRANPEGVLREQSATNNVELREVILSGKLHRRRVEVPPWNGIDSETGIDIGQGGGFF